MVRIKQEQLLDELRRWLGGTERRLTAVADGPAGVQILHKGHCRAVWHWQGCAYAFTPAGYGAPTFAAATAEDAVRYTLAHFCPPDQRAARSDSPAAAPATSPIAS
jgi:hypothetical protein